MLDEKWPLGYVQVYGDAVVDRDAELAAGVLNQVLGLMAGEPVPPERWPQVKEMARREHRVVIRVRPYATFATPPRMFTILCTLCRRRHKFHYADLPIMPTWRREPLVAAV
jgi:hypothetical protein